MTTLRKPLLAVRTSKIAESSHLKRTRKETKSVKKDMKTTKKERFTTSTNVYSLTVSLLSTPIFIWTRTARPKLSPFTRKSSLEPLSSWQKLVLQQSYPKSQFINSQISKTLSEKRYEMK